MHSSSNKARRGISLLIVLMLALLATAPSALAKGNAPADPQVLPPQSRAYGATYGEWSARWWQWVFSLPTSTNSVETHPFLTNGAIDCSYGQSGKVWYLVGTFIVDPDPDTGLPVNKANRSCSMPTGTALFFPILNAEADDIGGDGQPLGLSVEALRAWANDNMASATYMYAEIDGRVVADPARYRVQSPVFALTLPENNLYQFFGYEQVHAGTYSPAVADGVFLMLAPLPAGKHTIVFRGENPGFKLDIRYDITVTPGK